ncbi:MAG TPA: hypothetical protein VHV26_14645 [Rhizomicrobium sp.]|jgi:hypothetical protein|nr:hypothetical protein [Rhizomicrobium sp.]
MMSSRRSFLLGTTAAFASAVLTSLPADAAVLTVSTAMEPPEWALLQRELMAAHTDSCTVFFRRYFNQATGWLEETARWGGDDGPDDAIENVNDWPHLYALGCDASLKRMYSKAYEGHVRQYTAAKTTDVPFAKDGMYYKEFPVMMDWQHNGEGLTVFNLMGLGDPYNRIWRDRVLRFTGFYDGEDPGAPNYDPKLKLIRSMFTGSRGPLLRKATALDWTGDPIDVKNRFPSLGHGEDGYAQMLDHFRGYEETLGDTPLNLVSTTLGTNAYLITHDAKYKKWVLEYVDAWVGRAHANNDILPSNVGRDGVIGSDADGKWYGGTYGWGFSPVVPMTGKHEDRNRIPRSFVGFMNAYLLSGGDDKYLEVWRRQADKIDAQAKMVNSKTSSPTMYGDQGWYSFRPGKYNFNFLEIYFLSMKPSDRARAEETDWYHFLEGKNPDYPVRALRAGLAHIRRNMAIVRADTTSPDMRLADSALDYNPASVTALTQLMEAGLYIQHPGWAKTTPGQGGSLLFCRLRYFDPERRRAGISPDVAALVEGWSDDSLTVTYVNVNPTYARSLMVQGGAYAEHQILSASDGKTTLDVNAPHFPLRLAPGAGAKLTIKMKRFANDPTLSFPWEDTVADLGDSPAIDRQRSGAD